MQTRPGIRPTIADVAREAGVSVATVSRVLNRTAPVADTTRLVVEAAVERVGFRVNAAARTLRTARTALVGLLVPQINHEVFGSIAEQMEEALRPRSIGVAITSSGWRPEADVDGIDALESRGVDALVVCVADDRDPRTATRLREVKCPVVLIDREVPGLESDALLMDFEPGMTQALARLAELGHRRVALLTVTLRTRAGREITAAYRRAAAALGLALDDELVVEYQRPERHGGIEAGGRVLAAGATAVIVAVPMALLGGLLEYLENRGLRVPEDLSIVVYSDNELAVVKRPRLSVVTRPVAAMGRRAAGLVLARLDEPGSPWRTEVIRTGFVERESLASPRAAAP